MGYERTRSEGPQQTMGTATKTVESPNGTVNFHSSHTHQLTYFHKTISDVVTPGYKKLIRQGAIINNPMHLSEERFVSGGGILQATSLSTGKIYTTQGGSVTQFQRGTAVASSQTDAPEVVLDDLSSMIATAKSYAIANIDPSNYAFAEDLFEVSSTLRYLRNPVGAIRKLTKELTRSQRKLEKKYRRTADVASAVADLHLQYNFAFQPLLRSSLDAIEAYNRVRAVRQPVRRTARGFANSEGEDSGTQTVTLAYGAVDTYDMKVSKSRSVKASILYETPLPYSDLQMNLGLRASDIPETLWAVVPFSFIVDRVVDISGAIRGLTNLTNPAIRILAGNVTIKEASSSSDQYINQTDSNATVHVTGDIVKHDKFSYDRTIWYPTAKDAIPPSDLANVVSNAQYISDLLALSAKALSSLTKN